MERFIHDGPIKDKILALRNELHNVNEEIEPLEKKRKRWKQGRGRYLFNLVDCIPFLDSPNSLRLYDLWQKREMLQNEIEHLEREAFFTATDNQRKAYHLDEGTVRAIIHELRARESINDYSWQEFEELVAKLFDCFGWKVIATPYQNDGGKDLIVEVNSIRMFVECKHFSGGGVVGRPVFQKLKGAMVDSCCPNGLVVTSSRVSAPAREFGENNGIAILEGKELWDLLISNQIIIRPNGIKNYVLHCSNCLRKYTFEVSDRIDERKCPCGNRVSNSTIVHYGNPDRPLPYDLAVKP